MEKNIYIRALEIGANHMKDGITYEQMLNKLSAINMKPDGNFEAYFRRWFYSHFYIADIYEYRGQHGTPFDFYKLRNYDNQVGVLMEKGYTEYLDFQKLEKAKTDTKKAHDLALWAIFISGGMALIQIFLQLFQSNNFCD